MDIYLVGGAVRDKLLGLPVKEKDWVVVGSTPEEMLAQGFIPVGKEFPVFLHPETHEEYALARTERKVGKGYKGFTFYAATDVTLADDLKRRDLTINAMAETADGHLIDPYEGQQDLSNKILRHVSPAFQEDPVRILRVARFSAQFPDFSVHPDTLAFMRHMVKAGEVSALVPERVWQELARSLASKKPSRFFDVLFAAEAMSVLFPEITESSTGLSVLDGTASAHIRLAVLLHDLSQDQLENMCKRYHIPTLFAELAILVNRYHTFYQNCLQASAEALLNFMTRVDALRRPERFMQFLTACEIIENKINTKPYRKRLEQVLAAIQSVNTQPLQEKNLTGTAFAEELKKLRISAIEKA